jgi:hypothetical protein
MGLLIRGIIRKDQNMGKENLLNLMVPVILVSSRITKFMALAHTFGQMGKTIMVNS